MKNPIIQTAVLNNKGRIRGNNEDNFIMNDVIIPLDKINDGATLSRECRNPYQVYAVCDGMGGIESGEIASYTAVEKLRDAVASHMDLLSRPGVISVLRSISDVINSDASTKGQKSGTTIAMVVIDGERAIVANVGDSRVYRMQGERLKQISVDHSEVQRLINMGMLTPEEARTSPRRHIIKQYLGMSPEIRVSPAITENIQLKEGDVYLLCSDGLTDMVEDDDIQAIFRRHKDPQEAARALLKAALDNGGRDNVTVMVLRVKRMISDNGVGAPDKNILNRVLTGAQILIGTGFLLTAVDLIYYLLHKY